MSRPLVFIPRRADKLSSTAQRVALCGYDIEPFPLITFTPLKFELPEVQGIVVTSSAALESLPKTNLPLYCVGKATAVDAIEYGFNVQHIGNGNGEDLAQWIIQNLNPKALLHPTSRDAACGWYEALEGHGFKVHQIHAYKKAYASELPAEVVCCLSENKVSFTLVFSAKSAALLIRLCQQHNLPLKALGTVVAISKKAAAPFDKQLNVRVAKHPELQEMLNVLEQTTF